MSVSPFVHLNIHLSVCHQNHSNKIIQHHPKQLSFLDFPNSSTLLVNWLSTSIDFLHLSTFYLNQLSTSINFLHQTSFFISCLSLSIIFLNQLTFFVNQPSRFQHYLAINFLCFWLISLQFVRKTFLHVTASPCFERVC